MTKISTKTTTSVPPLKDNNNELKFFFLEDKANRLAEDFAKTFTSHNEPSISEFIRETDDIVESYLTMLCNEGILEIKPYEIKSILNSLKRIKAQGSDEITNFELKK